MVGCFWVLTLRSNVRIQAIRNAVYLAGGRSLLFRNPIPCTTAKEIACTTGIWLHNGSDENRPVVQGPSSITYLAERAIAPPGQEGGVCQREEKGQHAT